MKCLRNIAYIAAAIVLMAGVFFLATAQLDDANMATFKGTAAAFIRSGKASAPLGAGVGRICMSYNNEETVAMQLLPLFPARKAEIENMPKGGDKAELVVAVQNSEGFTVMTGRRDITVDGKSYLLAVPRQKGQAANEGPGCFNSATATLSKVGDTVLLSGTASADAKKPSAAKPQMKKKKPAAAPAKKAAPARSYGY